jgi:uncharacterized RDD family membrane protein YckC
MANGDWYYAQGGQQQGPVPLETLRQMYAAGQVQPGDLVWTSGMPNWLAASSVPALTAAPAAPGMPAPQQPYGTPQYGAQQYGSPQYPGSYFPGQGAVGYYTPTREVVYAGFWMRFAAQFIDGLILMVPYFLIAVALMFALGIQDEIMNPQPNAQPSAGRIVFELSNWVVWLLMNWLYSALQESSRHMATVGKRALGIVVTDMNGNRISFGRASGRFFGEILSGCICYIGYIMAGFTERKQALHDMLAGTLVIRKPDAA